MNKEKMKDLVEELWQMAEILTGTLEVIHGAAKGKEIVGIESYKNAILGTVNMAHGLTFELQEILQGLNE